MPNNEEERRKLACVMCNHGCKNQIKDGDPDCQMCLLFADHVIKAGWKSPLDCNKCIDESALRVSDTIQQAREEERKEIGKDIKSNYSIFDFSTWLKVGVINLCNGKSLKGE